MTAKYYTVSYRNSPNEELWRSVMSYGFERTYTTKQSAVRRAKKELEEGAYEVLVYEMEGCVQFQIHKEVFRQKAE